MNPGELSLPALTWLLYWSLRDSSLPTTFRVVIDRLEAVEGGEVSG